MDNKSATSLSLPPSLRRRTRGAPTDVPEDVALLHFNDPNYDFNQYDTDSIGDDSFEMDEKRRGGRLSIAGHSVKTSPSDYDTESHIESSRADSRMHIRSTDHMDYEDESPYAEVRAAVSNVDDPTMPVGTFRAWMIGFLFCIITSGLNQFFSMRYPTVFITALVSQLAALPAGKVMERVLPTTKFRTFGYTWTLNPGPFNIKEHTLITIMANVSMGAYATDVIATQQVYFNQYWGVGYQLMLCLSSQVVGFAFAGIVRQFLVWPAAMIWPGALVNAALLNTLHRNYGKRDGKHISRERFFVIMMAASFVWYWFPGYIFTALSVFNWVCWIAPNNVVVNQLFGYSTGLGMGFLTFDWAMISYVGSPLVVPWWAQVNTLVAFVLIYWIIAPILYYKNVFFSKFLPMSAPMAFDRTGAPYDPSAIIQDGTFNQELYKAYSPIYMPITFVMYYGISFAALTATITHTILWYRRDIMRQFRRSIHDHHDVHARLMSAYKEVPHYWYLILFIASFAIGITTVEVYDTKLPIWGLVLALLLSLVFLVPVGMIHAITNQTVPLQILAELIIGYILPGRPVAMMIFKTFSFISMSQAISFVGDLKLGHYMKIPPRTMFTAQIAAQTLSVVVVVFVQNWMFANIPDMCMPGQKHRFVCPSTNVFATAAMIWGGVGPARLFSIGTLYHPIMYFFLIGAVLPVPFYFLARRYPLSLWRCVNIPVFFAGVTGLPPATGINFSSWFAVGSVFQYYMRRFHFRWWMRYNYILSAALDSGVALGLVIIFFTVQFPKGGFSLNWWGNTVWQKTADAMGAPFYSLEPGQTFGPSVWS